MNVLSLFDGMSCGQIALKKLGIEFDGAKNKYFASEIKKHGIKVTMDNFPNTIQLGDVTKINFDKLGKIDILIGGSPCQDLSCANKERKGLEGDKSKLFYEWYRAFKTLKPKYFLLENVGSAKKEDIKIITKLLGVEPIRINSFLVSPQLRNRLYWTNIPQAKLIEKEIMLNDCLENGWSDRKKARCLLESDSRPLSTPVKMFHRYYSTGFNTLIFENENHYNKCKNHYEAHYKDKSAKEIDKMNIDNSIYDGVRYMNKSELEKMQTVPAGYTSCLKRNEAASVLGDGWTVDIIAHILSGIDIKQ